jgi:putative membrane protein
MPIISIKRVVIKHSGRLEESYAVLGRYIRMLITDPRYSKFSLGVPGLLFLIIGLLSVFNLLQLAIQVVLIILGIALIVWGFDLVKYITSIRKMKKMSSYIRFFSIIATLLVISVAFYQGFYVSIGKESIPLFMSTFLEKSLPLTWIGLSIYLGYSLVFNWVRKSIRIWRDIFAFLILAFLYIPILEVSRILVNPGQSPFTLILQLLLGLIVTSIVAVIAYRRIHSYKKTVKGA